MATDDVEDGKASGSGGGCRRKGGGKCRDGQGVGGGGYSRAVECADAVTMRNIIGRVHVEDGDMGHGCIIVVDDPRTGGWPLACVEMPFRTQAENRAVAEWLSDAWNGRRAMAESAGA